MGRQDQRVVRRDIRAVGEQPIGSWRRRLRDLGAWALDRIPPEETTLGGLPPVISSVEVAYPQSADVRVVQRLLRDELLGAKADLTRRRAWTNAADRCRSSCR